jgi:hypothetical protein
LFNFSFSETTCAGKDQTAVKTTVETSTATDVKNQLAWIHIHAIKTRNNIFFKFLIISSLPPYCQINHLNITYTK